MTKNLVIVESPAKARTIERYLGSDFKVLASYGHVRDLPENPGKGKFGVDGWLAFGAVFGFLSCLAMVLFAKGLGWFLKRDENYYRERDDA